MERRGELPGVTSVGFLFGMIGVFLLVVTLRSMGYDGLAAVGGTAGCAVLAITTGIVLWRKWRAAGDYSEFDDDGDVWFCEAVFLLACMGLTGALIRATGVAFGKASFLLLLVLSAAGPVVRHYIAR